MATKVKWDINGKGVEPGSGQFGYQGPDLPKGSYVAKVKRVTLSEIKSAGANQGRPRLSVLLEVVGGAGSKSIPDTGFKYYSAPVWDGLNIIDSSVPFVNAFLHALSDGTEAGKRKVEHAFWDMDKIVKKVKVEKGPRSGQIDKHLIKFGSFIINSPNGEILVRITTKPDKDLNGNYRPSVSGYLPYDGPQASLAADDEDEDDELLEGDDDEDYDEDEELEDSEDDEEDEEEDAEDDDEDYDDEESAEDDREVATAGSRRKPPF